MLKQASIDGVDGIVQRPSRNTRSNDSSTFIYTHKTGMDRKAELALMYGGAYHTPEIKDGVYMTGLASRIDIPSPTGRTIQWLPLPGESWTQKRFEEAHPTPAEAETAREQYRSFVGKDVTEAWTDEATWIPNFDFSEIEKRIAAHFIAGVADSFVIYGGIKGDIKVEFGDSKGADFKDIEAMINDFLKPKRKVGVAPELGMGYAPTLSRNTDDDPHRRMARWLTGRWDGKNPPQSNKPKGGA
jgi:hypothetical protein